MSELTGHAAFHLAGVVHRNKVIGNVEDRRAILKESMRHLNPRDVKRHAGKNPSIVAADAHLNTAWFNDGNGGFAVATKVRQVVDYGTAREQRVRRAILDSQVTTNTFVVHLPKTMCEEVPDFYPRMKDGKPRLDPVTGEPMSRSRWVSRDRDEATRYFQDAVTFLGMNVVPGGQPAIHGWATNFDETTPHIQLMADPFGDDPKHDGALMTKHAQAYGSSREVRNAQGQQIAGPVKMRNYQAAMREFMVARGWPVEAEAGKRHGQELSKPDYEDLMDEKADMASREALVMAAFERVDQHKVELDAQEAALVVRQSSVMKREAALPALEDAAHTTGFVAGQKSAAAAVQADLEEADAVLQAARLAKEAAEAARGREEALEADLKELLASAPKVPTWEEFNRAVTGSSESFAMTWIRRHPAVSEKFDTDRHAAYDSYARTVTGKRQSLDEWSSTTLRQAVAVRRPPTTPAGQTQLQRGVDRDK